MILSATKRATIESYWTDYFRHLDQLAPHTAGSRAATLTNARAITCYACKDGVLCWFDAGPKLNITHRSSGPNIETMFNKLTAPVGINFAGEFPATHDVGPVTAAEVYIGKTATMPVLHYRAVWDRKTTFKTTKSPEERAEHDHQPEQGKPSLWTMPLSKASKPQKHS